MVAAAEQGLEDVEREEIGVRAFHRFDGDCERCDGLVYRGGHHGFPVGKYGVAAAREERERYGVER